MRWLPLPLVAVVAIAALACTPVLPARFEPDFRGVRVFRVAPVAPGLSGAALALGYTPLAARGLSLAWEWGDDAGRFDGAAHPGPTLSGDRRLVWTEQMCLVVDTSTAQPVRGFRWPEALAGAGGPRVIALDAGERWIAVATHQGAVWLGGFDGTGFAQLAPALRLATPDDLPLEGAEPAGYDTVAFRPWRAEAAHGAEGVIERGRQRLFFSPDGARLAGGMDIWDVATRRPSLVLRADEAVLSVDAGVEHVTVAQLAIRTETGRPGSQCGFIPVTHTVVARAVEERTVDGTAAPRLLPSRALDDPGVRGQAPAATDASTQAPMPVTAVDVDVRGEVAVVIGRRAWRVSAQGARELRWPTRGSIRRAAFVPGGVALQGALEGGARVVQTTAVFDGEGRARRALAGGIPSALNRVGRMVVRDDAGWSVWDATLMERLRALPDPGRLHLGALEQARVTDAGLAVLWEEEPGAHVFLVVEGRAWRRVRVTALSPTLCGWSLAPDGQRVALHEPHTFRVVDLRDGRERFRHVIEGEPVASALLGDRVYLADDRGTVREFTHDGELRAQVDLSGRFDRATALALSPDGGYLAVGSARSRVFVFRVDQGR